MPGPGRPGGFGGPADITEDTADLDLAVITTDPQWAAECITDLPCTTIITIWELAGIALIATVVAADACSL